MDLEQKAEMTYVNLHNKQHEGITLIETMLVLFLLGVIATSSTILIKRWINSYKLKATAQQLMTDFHLAMTEAIRSQSNVAIVFNSDNITGDNSSYQIFVDDGANGAVADNFILEGGNTSHPKEKLLVNRHIPKNIKVYKITFLSNRTGYNPLGFPLHSLWGAVYLTDNSNFYKMTLINTGRVKLYFSKDGTNWE